MEAAHNLANALARVFDLHKKEQIYDDFPPIN
jgi:hypothetical protein